MTTTTWALWLILNKSIPVSKPEFTIDIENAKKSISKLLNYDAETIICYHGGMYKPSSNVSNISNIIERLSDSFMGKRRTYYLYNIAGILFAITAIIYFFSNKVLMGITYISLAITFTSLGIANKRKTK